VCVCVSVCVCVCVCTCVCACVNWEEGGGTAVLLRSFLKFCLLMDIDTQRISYVLTEQALALLAYPCSCMLLPTRR
jgi:hypothetical protein